MIRIWYALIMVSRFTRCVHSSSLRHDSWSQSQAWLEKSVRMEHEHATTSMAIVRNQTEEPSQASTSQPKRNPGTQIHRSTINERFIENHDIHWEQNFDSIQNKTETASNRSENKTRYHRWQSIPNQIKHQQDHGYHQIAISKFISGAYTWLLFLVKSNYDQFCS